tara:strand:+ start:559 stop:1005 length:447 start_codon:yes stop_codon:yes gene_type:complete
MKKLFTLLVSLLVSASVYSQTYNVNTFYAELGGYVIEVRDGGKHGLVVAMQDQISHSTWFEADDELSNATNHDTDGAKFMDWRLPTKRELNVMYGVFVFGNEANFSGDHYWSSTEYDERDAWSQYFGNGKQESFIKSGPNIVRAVRAF